MFKIIQFRMHCFLITSFDYMHYSTYTLNKSEKQPFTQLCFLVNACAANAIKHHKAVKQSLTHGHNKIIINGNITYKY